MTNLSDGGEGQINYSHSEEAKANISKGGKEQFAKSGRITWNKGLKGWHTPEMLENIRTKVSQNTKGKKKKYTEEGLKRLQEAVSKRMTGSKRSEATLARMRVAQAVRRQDEQARGFKSPNMKGVKGKPAWNKGLTKKTDSRLLKQGWSQENMHLMREMVSRSQKGKPKKAEAIAKGVITRKLNNQKRLQQV